MSQLFTTLSHHQLVVVAKMILTFAIKNHPVCFQLAKLDYEMTLISDWSGNSAER